MDGYINLHVEINKAPIGSLISLMAVRRAALTPTVASVAAPYACCRWTQSRGDTTSSSLLTHASADQPQTKIVQPWLINSVFTDGYDAGQMYRLLVR